MWAWVFVPIYPSCLLLYRSVSLSTWTYKRCCPTFSLLLFFFSFVLPNNSNCLLLTIVSHSSPYCTNFFFFFILTLCYSPKNTLQSLHPQLILLQWKALSIGIFLAFPTPFLHSNTWNGPFLYTYTSLVLVFQLVHTNRHTSWVSQYFACEF